MVAATNRQVQTAAYANNSRIVKPNMMRENTADFVQPKRVNVLTGPVPTSKKGNSLDTKQQAFAPPTLNASGGNFHIRSALSPTHADIYQNNAASYAKLSKNKSNMSDFETQMVNDAILSQRNHHRYGGHYKN
jgi:hypothetical protein